MPLPPAHPLVLSKPAAKHPSPQLFPLSGQSCMGMERAAVCGGCVRVFACVCPCVCMCPCVCVCCPHTCTFSPGGFLLDYLKGGTVREHSQGGERKERLEGVPALTEETCPASVLINTTSTYNPLQDACGFQTSGRARGAGHIPPACPCTEAYEHGPHWGLCSGLR